MDEIVKKINEFTRLSKERELTEEEKKERADYVLNNNGTKEALYQQIDDMISDVMSRYE